MAELSRQFAHMMVDAVWSAGRLSVEFPAYSLHLNPNCAKLLWGCLPKAVEYAAMHHPDAEVDGKPTRFGASLHCSPFWEEIGEAMTSDAVRCAVANVLGLSEGTMHPWVALIRDMPGYQIRPHPDSAHKLATLQVYLTNSYGHPEMGTTFHDHGSTHKVSVPYCPGGGYFFRRSNASYHSVAPIRAQRDSLILVYFDSPKTDFP